MNNIDSKNFEEMDNIDDKNYEEMSDYIYNNNKSADELLINNIDDIQMFRKERGKYKLKKRSGNKPGIKEGDRVTNGKKKGVVIDIDDDVVCVGINGNVEVWDINDVKVLK